LDLTALGTNDQAWGINDAGEIVGFTGSSGSSVPAPIVGAGLPGLIAACGGLVALARRRRQRVV
jgi:hypothetical protein